MTTLTAQSAPNATRLLQQKLGSEVVRTDAILRYAFANDAGPYLLIPQAVVQPSIENQIVELFRLANERRMPVVFRAGGTSLSGQSITDGWLVDIGRHWRKVEVLESGERVRVQPGAVGGLVNAHLRPFSKKIGPDPSSIMSAMMGGILSNNSSGMCCGVRHNAYHTLDQLRFILPDGTIWDTAFEGEHERFEQEQKALAEGLIHLKKRIEGDSTLSRRIRQKYQQKNTVGYSLNAFLDYDRPLDILAHLLIGGEGTLAFISQAVLRTIDDLPVKGTSMIYFEDVMSACASIPALIKAGCEAIELMDFASLASIRNLEGVPQELPHLLDRWPSLTAILCEFHAPDDSTLAKYIESFEQVVAPNLVSIAPIEFTRDRRLQANLWKLRKGMYPAVAAVRARGEAAILEDIAVPVEQLGPAILDLQALFVRHGYENGIIFGHAKDGNLHFVITQSLEGEADVSKYEQFIDDMVRLVIERYGGALKAEHGTGRNMAPFVETEWGREAVEIMRELKSLVDPNRILNPDVILSETNAIHLKNLKSLPVVEDVVDKCIECGACEPRCPSRDFTLSPRQRIVIRRALARESEANQSIARELEKAYPHFGLDTCATDGLCAVDCPVAINTGTLVKQLRQEKRSRIAYLVAQTMAGSMWLVEWSAIIAISTGKLVNQVFGPSAMTRLTGFVRRWVPSLPYWHRGIDYRRLPSGVTNPDWLYFPACMSRMLSGTADDLLFVAGAVGVKVGVVPSATGQCCGQAFSSKGFSEIGVQIRGRLIEHLWRVSERGRIPIVTDLGSCTHFLTGEATGLDESAREKLQELTILDSVVFCDQILLPQFVPKRKRSRVAVHSLCTHAKTGWGESLARVARACSDEVVFPHDGGCCGMGGDRGLVHPGLTNAATSTAGEKMEKMGCEEGFTTARSCGLALETSTGKPWRSIFALMRACIEKEST